MPRALRPERPTGPSASTPRTLQQGPLRLAIVGDIHHGADKLTKRGSAALSLLDQFLDFAAGSGADLIVDLGDRISDIDRETDLKLLTEVAGRFATSNLRRAHLHGNHDTAFLSGEENAAALGIGAGHSSLDIKGFHLAFWQPDARIPYPEPFRITTADLDWLAADLAATRLPTILFSHVPLSGASMVGNYWFANSPDHGGYPNAADARRVIAANDHVVLCVAGHVHWNALHRVEAVPHITIQSLTESFTTGGEPAAAWATLEIGDDIRWRTFGRDPIEVTLALRQPGERWPEPLPNVRTRMVAARRPGGLQGIKGLLLDLDGVLYRGSEPIPAGGRLLAYAQSRGLPVAALTNNARRTAEKASAKLAGMGFAIAPEMIVTAGLATALHVKARHPGARVLAVGPEALLRELQRAGVAVVTGEETADIVVAAIDEELTMAALRRAANHIRRGAGLIVANPDATHPTPDGVALESGAIQALLERAGGKPATVVGKPMAGIFELALRRLGLTAGEVLMVGDTPETDIAGALAAGLRSALVGPAGSAAGAALHAPTVTVSDLDQLVQLLANAG